MRILDRYILKSVVSVFLGCLLTFLFLYIVIDTFSHLDEILKTHVSLSTLKQYYFSYLPIIFTQMAPIACLLATIYTFATFNRNNEIIAMRSAGLSIFQISKTVLIFGALISVLVFWVGDRFVPASLSTTEKVKSEMEKGVRDAGKENEYINNLFVYGLRNRLFFINRFSTLKNTMEGITILEHDEHQNISKKIVATRGAYQDGIWRFYQSISYTFDINGQIINEPQYLEEEIMPISETPKDFLNQRLLPEFMTIAQLDDYIWKLSKSGATTVIRNLKVDFYQRFASALTSLIIMLLGIPFSVMMKKRATGISSIGVSLGVGFLYYVLSAISLSLGKAGMLMPILAASLSHIIALSAAVYLINKIP